MDNQQFNQDQNYQNQSEPYAPYQPPVEQGPVGSVKTFVFSLLSVAVSQPIVGLVFAIIARRMIATFEQYNGVTNYGLLKASKILSKIGYILGIISTICFAFVCTIWFCVIIGVLASHATPEVQSNFATILPLIF
jgi:hypothetical protein